MESDDSTRTDRSIEPFCGDGGWRCEMSSAPARMSHTLYWTMFGRSDRSRPEKTFSYE